MKILLLICAILLSSSAMARMYRVVGPDGRVTYTDVAPQGNNASVQEVTTAGKRGTSASQSADLVMYATQTCPHCKQARAYMKAKGISYREVDVGRDMKSSPEFTRLGGRGVPLFSLSGQTLAGFSEQSFEDFLRSAR